MFLTISPSLANCSWLIAVSNFSEAVFGQDRADVDDRDRAGAQIAAAQHGLERALDGCAVHVKRQVLVLGIERAGREQEPEAFLRRGLFLLRPKRRHDLERLLELRRAGPAFAHQRQHRRRVAKCRAVIGAARQRHLAIGLHERGKRRVEGKRGALLIAQHGKARGELRLRDRRRERIDLRVGVVAQVAEHAAPGTRQHIERIGERFAAGLEVARVVDGVLQPVDGQLIVHLADGEALLLGARQEVGHVGGQPHVLVRRPPKPEAAGRGLHFVEARNRSLDGQLSPSVLC